MMDGQSPWTTVDERKVADGSIERARLHRYQFVASLCAGRAVVDVSMRGPDQELVRSQAQEFSTTWQNTLGNDQEVLLHLDVTAHDDLRRILSACPQVFFDAGLFIFAAKCSDERDARHLSEVAGGWFRNIQAFTQQAASVTLFVAPQQTGSRIIPLAAPLAAGPLRLYFCSNHPLPRLSSLLMEATDENFVAEPLVSQPSSNHRAALTQIKHDLRDATEGSLSRLEPDDLRGRAIGLVNRLLDVETVAFNLRVEGERLKAALRQQDKAAAGGSFFDFPHTDHGWLLKQNPSVLPSMLDKYDCRVDDEAVVEGRRGDQFLQRFRLLGDDPDFGSALQALHEAPSVLQIRSPTDSEPPDVSIVIPVYGQLAYTLNCLDSLFAHKSKFSVEIIVIDDVSPDRSGEFLAELENIRYHRQPVNGGFITSCNTGAEMARGRFLLMLNNDTRVVAGWLDEIIGTFSLFERAGLVGSKLLYPDGVLQEAGGILWRDGNAWNYGRNDDPNRPQYSYARQVDFISGCSIALPRSLWSELGGFDQYYRPAYCEDSDLALRVAKSGYQVWYQPKSRIIHYEGRTSGTDTSTGAKAYQIGNLKKLFRRWRPYLEDHQPSGLAPYFERERGVRRRALVIDATTPTPEQDAGSVTTTLVLQLFTQLGYKTHFVPQDNFLFLAKHTGDLQRIGIECAYAPYDINLDVYLRLYGFLFDVVQVFRAPVLEKVLPAVREHAPGAVVLFNNMDLHYLRKQREAEISGDVEAIELAASLKDHELAIMRKCDCIITPSTYEKSILDHELPGAPLIVLPFMIDYAGTEVGFEERRDICFLGGYRHTPNIDAVLFFVEEVFPLIKAAEPGIRFIIAGAHPTEEIKALASDDIIVTGLVPDLRDVFDTTRVFACSLRAGAGVKGKVASAMSYGLPIVSTSCGAEGMDLEDGEEVLLADEPADFAAACVRLYRSPDLWNRLSKAGLARVRSKHSLEMGQAVMTEAIEIAVAHKLGLPLTLEAS